MKHITLALLLLAACASVSFTEVTVESTFPANGAKDVDPTIGAIRVRFSAPVNTGGYSCVNTQSGEPVPITGKPRFEENDTVCILPVKLEPGVTYSISINSERYQNWRGAADGKPVVPYELTFTTAGENEPLTAAQWREDLAFLAKELPAKHKNLFFKITREQFEAKVADLDKRIPGLRDDQILVGMTQLVAAVGDEHSEFGRPRSGMTYLPIMCYWFKDGMFVMSASEEYKSALGYRVEKIGDLGMDLACDKLASLVAHDNHAQVKKAMPILLCTTQLLTGLGIAADPNKIPLLLRSASREVFAIDVVPVQSLGSTKMLQAYDITKNPPLYLAHTNKAYWSEYVADRDMVYFQYNRCSEMSGQPFAAFQDDLRKLVTAHPTARLVIDLRDNPGGNSAILDPFIDWLKANKEANQKGKLYVLIGRRTLSSAILNAMRLRTETAATLVGEPTSGAPNHYGEVKSFVLPNSKITVTYSTKYFQYSEKNESTITPDILVELTSRDYLSGVDPVLDAIK